MKRGRTKKELERLRLVTTDMALSPLVASYSPRTGQLASPRKKRHPDKFELVLYRPGVNAEGAMVLYDPLQHNVVARQFPHDEPSSSSHVAVDLNRQRRCPLCQSLLGGAPLVTGSGQGTSTSTNSLDPYMSDSYFAMLQYLNQARPLSLGVSQPEEGSSNPFIVRPLIEGTAGGSAPSSPTGAAGSEEDAEKAASDLRHMSAGMLNNGYYRRFFREMKLLGNGSFGAVYLCNHVIDEVFLGDFAVKKVAVGDDRQWLRRMMKEVKALERLATHPNIVSYKHSWLEMHRANQMCPYVPFLFILMSFCDSGSVEGLIWQSPHPQTLSDSVVWSVFIDTCQGLQHLHHNYVLHRDLKPSNILLTADRDCACGFRAVLSDFGTAEIVGDGAGSGSPSHSGFTGTVEYTAPEVLDTDNHLYCEQTDMWSLGIVLYALCYSRVPYSDSNPKECAGLISKHVKLNVPTAPLRGEDLQHLMVALTAKDPRNRPRCSDILYHPFVRARVVERSTQSGDHQPFTI